MALQSWICSSEAVRHPFSLALCFPKIRIRMSSWRQSSSLPLFFVCFCFVENSRNVIRRLVKAGLCYWIVWLNACQLCRHLSREIWVIIWTTCAYSRDLTQVAREVCSEVNGGRTSNDGSKTILFLFGGLAESIIFVLCCSSAEVFLLHQGHVEIKIKIKVLLIILNGFFSEKSSAEARPTSLSSQSKFGGCWMI